MHKRIENLKKLMKQQKIDLLIVEDPFDLFYLTGMHLSCGKLLIKPRSFCLFVDGRYITAVKHFPSALLSDEALAAYAKGAKRSAFDSSCTSYSSFLQLKKWAPHLKPWDGPTRTLRAIKDLKEKEKLKKAAKLCGQGYDYALTLLKEGISEKEVAIELEIFWKKRQSGPLSFESIIAFGSNSALPHHRAAESKLKIGDTVLIDIGISLDEYQSDMTRTVFFGKPHEKMKKIYAIVKEAQEKAFDLCRSGVKIGDVDKAARDYITKKGFGEFFMHGLGHSLGLCVHEWPYLRNKPGFKDLLLEEGMAVTIEPGIYLEGLGGVRIENTILIRKQGFEDLTQRGTDLVIL